MLKVKRHRFIRRYYVYAKGKWEAVTYDPDNPDRANLATPYSDHPVIVRLQGAWPTSSSTQPSLVARMPELLDILPGMRVLEIGTGTGYNAALLAELLGDPGLVWTVESQPDVAEEAKEVLAREGYGGVHVAMGDGFYGAPEGAPYDRIEATVGCSDLSPHWLEQLSPQGFMLIPLQHGHWHPLVRVTHRAGHPGQAQGEIVGWHPEGEAKAGERLYARLLDVLARWERLGRPGLDDYQLIFIPKSDPLGPNGDPGRTWLIERARFWEAVRLP
ncbi:MAG: methyltransferase [Candidatus Acetothermia bacterium]|nr:methyltransferase [Candidatus Acetothermia bacterium]